MPNSTATPDFTNAWYDAQLPTWQFLQDLLAGQDAVKQKSTTYLPQEPAELAEDYQRRLKGSVFFEDYRDCVVNLAGMVFRKPPSLGEDVPEMIRGREEVRDGQGQVTTEPKEGLAENIDNAGTHINVFLQRAFQDGFNGHTFIVVDMPSNPGVQTAQDEMVSGGRSYWCLRKAIDTLNWRTSVVNGRTILTQITFQEVTIEPDGLFGEIEVVRYRVYRLNELGNAEWQLWEQQTSDQAGESKIVMVDRAEIKTKKGLPLKRLPVAVHYGEYEGVLQSRPPLKGIADINISYYQKYSDLSNIEHMTCAVTLCITGVDDQSGDKTLGGNRVIYLPQVGSTAEFLTVDGDSIPALERDLQMLEKRMLHKGLDFVQEDNRVPITATEAELSWTQRTSKLANMVRSLKDAAETALSITAEMEGLDQGGRITIGVDEKSLTLTPEQLRVYSEMADKGQLTLTTLWAMMAKADALPDDFNPEEEQKALEGEAEKRMERQAKQFNAGDDPLN